MKKAAIAVTALIVCGTLAGYLCMRDNKPAAQVTPQNSQPVQQVATTRAPEEYKPAFAAVVVPEHMKQQYTVNPKASQVITGNSGTMLLIPDNAFTDKNGNPVDGKVKLELVEALDRQDLIDLNLGTMSEQGMLETGGTIYLGAKSESGEELILAEGKTIEAEIPTLNKKPGMQLWEGKQNEDGSVTWINPEPIKETLLEVPVATLADSAGESDVLIDQPQGVAPVVVQPQKVVLAWFDWTTNMTFNKTFVQDGDTMHIWRGDTIRIDDLQAIGQEQTITGTKMNGRLDIVNFADEKFEHTNIATAEFRSRLPFIRQACDVRIAHCYADHPNRALWKSDAAAADTLEQSGCPLAEVFRQFAEMKQDKVDPQDPKTAAALDAARQKAIERYSKKTADIQAAYSSYSFGMKKLGWANVDRLAGTGNRIRFNAHVDGFSKDEAPVVSLLIPSRGIYLPGYRRPNGDYSFTHGEYELTADYPKGEHAFILARIGSGNNLKYGLKEVIFDGNVTESVSMQRGTEAELAEQLGSMPPETKEQPVKILDNWFTQSIKNGSACVCNGESNGIFFMK
jgi:hypothetical protein